MKSRNFLNRLQGAFLQMLPALVLVFSLLITFIVSINQRQTSYDVLNREFQTRSQDIFDRFRNRLNDYGQVLRGGAGLFASNKVGRDEWHRYVNVLNIDQNLPGIQGLGFSLAIKPEEKAAHIDNIRREGFPSYIINPDGQRELYTSIIYLEPFFGRNLRAFGYDMYSEPVRRAAMSAACDENRIALSGKVKLVQETETDVQAGFLMYLPVYKNNGSYDTVKERWENLLGWVYAPFRMNDFMKNLVEKGFSLNQYYLDIIIFDGSSINKNSVMYHYDKDIDPIIEGGRLPLLMFKQIITFGGHSWTVVIHSPYVFDTEYFDNKAVLIEIFGGLITNLRVG
ncbi:hypothetical protein CCP3SC15_2230002 [Gammaproteobacteria bacterium]